MLKKPCRFGNGKNEDRDANELQMRFSAKLSFSTPCYLVLGNRDGAMEQHKILKTLDPGYAAELLKAMSQ